MDTAESKLFYQLSEMAKIVAINRRNLDAYGEGSFLGSKVRGREAEKYFLDSKDQLSGHVDLLKKLQMI